MGCDGQVTVGTTVMKHNAKKVRKLYGDTARVTTVPSSSMAVILRL